MPTVRPPSLKGLPTRGGRSPKSVQKQSRASDGNSKKQQLISYQQAAKAAASKKK